MIPYVICTAHPDYKRPSVEHRFGFVEENEIDSFFVEDLSLFILERTSEINSVKDLEEFFQTYFDEYYLDNPVWDAMILKENKWVNICPSYESILSFIENYNLNNND